jgi:type I restriction enzyme S subunit
MILGEIMHMFSIPKGYKMTRVGIIPEDWRVELISNLSQKINGINPTNNPDQTFRYIDVSCISRDTLKITNYLEYNGKNAPSRARKLIENGDILFSTIRPYLKQLARVPATLDGEVCSTAFCIIRCDAKRVDPEYIFQSVTRDEFISNVSSLQNGSNYPAVTDKDIFSQYIPLPSLPEQHRIAAVLSTVDAAIAATDEVIAKTEELKRGLMQDLLTKGIDEEGRVRSEGTDIFCEKTINSTTFKFPEPWEFKAMGDVITLKRGYDLPSDERLAGNVPVISSSGISGYHQEAKVCGPGVVTGRYGTLGEVFFIERDFWPLNTTLYVCNFKGNDPKFISYFLRLHLAAYQSDALSIPGINRNFVHKLLCAVPPLPEQHRIAAILSAVDRDRLQTLKKGLMQDLLTGRVRVPPNGAGGTACPGPERVTACDLPPGHTP